MLYYIVYSSFSDTVPCKSVQYIFAFETINCFLLSFSLRCIPKHAPLTINSIVFPVYINFSIRISVLQMNTPYCVNNIILSICLITQDITIIHIGSFQKRSTPPDEICAVRKGGGVKFTSDVRRGRGMAVIVLSKRWQSIIHMLLKNVFFLTLKSLWRYTHHQWCSIEHQIYIIIAGILSTSDNLSVTKMLFRRILLKSTLVPVHFALRRATACLCHKSIFK